MKKIEIKKKIEKYIVENNLIEYNDKIVIAISGGADSVALFHILYEIRDVYNLTFVLAHINHLLRGENSDKDEEFVIAIGKKFSIETYTQKIDLKKYSEEHKIGLEEAGREVRYNFFTKVMDETKSSKVATAHNSDDNIETFLFRLIRGTGLEGLRGIPVKRGVYIRPLLTTPKSDILKYLDSNLLEYRLDESNLENIYTRNKIRIELIPYLEKNFNPLFKNKIGSLIQEINEMSDINFSETLIISNKIILEEYKKMDSFERKRCLNYYFKKNDIETNRKTIEQIDKMAFSEGCKYTSIMQNKLMFKGYKEIYISDKKAKSADPVKIIIGSKTIFNNKYIIGAEYVSEIKNASNCLYIDADMINCDDIVIRNRQDGDRFTPIGMTGTKKIKDFFSDIKLDRNKRDEIPLIVSDGIIVWICGVRASDKSKVTEDTKKIIKLTIEEVQNIE